jgi:glutamate dehydrogenase
VLTGRIRDLTFALEASRLASGVPEELSQRSAMWPLAHTAFDVIEMAQQMHLDVAAVAAAYWEMFEAVDAGWLWDAVGALPRSDRWQTQARSALRDDLLAALAELTADAVHVGGVDVWTATNERVLNRAASMFTEIRRAETYDVTTLSVALRQLRNVVLTTVRAH